MIAGRGFLERECNESIIQFDRFKALKEVKVAKQSGISEKWFAERSKEWSELARGARLDEDKYVSELSARLKCLKNLHFDSGSILAKRMFDELPDR